MKGFQAHVSGVVFLLIFGLGYVFLVPPFQAPDEPAHFARAYGVAEGQFVLRDHPPELVEFILASLDKYYDVGSVPLLNDMKMILDASDDRMPNIAYNTSQYSFIPYLYHAAVIKGVMVFREHPGDILLSLYLCRMATVIAYCLLFFAAVKLAPAFGWTMFWLASSPMALSQGSIMSTDFLVFGYGLILLCLGVAKSQIKWFPGVSLFAAFLLLVTKPPYAPLIMAPASAVLLGKNFNKWIRATGLAAGCLFALAAGYLWKEAVMGQGIYDFTMSYIHAYRSPDISPSLQLSHISDNIGHFAYVLWNTFFQNPGGLSHQFVGILGWQDLPLPGAAVIIWWLMLPLAFVHSSGRVDDEDRSALTGTFFVLSGVLTTIAVTAALYLVWMPVGAEYAAVQGRYFHLPFLAVTMGLLIILPGIQTKKIGDYIPVILLFAGAAINLTALFMVIEHYRFS